MHSPKQWHCKGNNSLQICLYFCYKHWASDIAGPFLPLKMIKMRFPSDYIKFNYFNRLGIYFWRFKHPTAYSTFFNYLHIECMLPVNCLGNSHKNKIFIIIYEYLHKIFHSQYCIKIIIYFQEYNVASSLKTNIKQLSVTLQSDENKSVHV